jgi:hypothetical protein
MKTNSIRTWSAPIIIGFVFAFTAFALQAQSCSVDWFTIDGGGGTSTGGVYAVSGTIGQPDAGALTGGNYTLQGGFWGIVAAVQTPGAPLLTITRSDTSVSVSWPSPSTGWTLQENPGLGTGSWATSGYTISDNGTNKFITVNSPTENLFFRLAH